MPGGGLGTEVVIGRGGHGTMAILDGIAALGRAGEGRLAGLRADNEVLRRLRSPATLERRYGICGCATECGACRAGALAATGDSPGEGPTRSDNS